MWWVIGGIVIAAAAVRWATGRAGPDHSERVARAFAALHRRRRVLIAGAKEGPVLIRGQVSSAGEQLTAPLSRKPCVFYDVRVTNLRAVAPDREKVGQAPPSTVVRRLREARPFFVTDETGTAEVAFQDAADVSFVVEPSLSLQGRRLRGEAAIQDVLRALGIWDEGSLAVNEAAIFIGDEVTVVGTGQRVVTASPPLKLVVRAGPNEGLAILKGKG